ncbi:hypothetical protein KFZ56_10555 [Virgibacillus sp. NKC19-3]|uniref:YphA family membrane protein n=1 Tax=Virgibacillus saliphilus TaxID=2831674 RepID=UPI001C9B1EE9|nr:hypothetical protein [Virgibacillus sp. NKC19-3]MBY7143478.1 hypothetical protein [Virgibacillus sp. NKC19-3]
MINGLLFYWFSWILWIVVTFFMKKSKRRTILACWILVTILSSSLSIEMQNQQISVAFLLLVGGSFILLIQLPRVVYHLFASFTIMIGYAAILFWEKSAPIWMIAPRVILISFILGLLITILTKGLYNQLSIGLLGLTCGEMINGLMLSSYGFRITIGEMQFFDLLLFILVILVFLEMLHKGKDKLYVVLQNHKQTVKWQNE